MLDRIRELLSSDDSEDVPTPQAVREAVEETEQGLDAARDRLDRLEAEHGRILLHATDAALDRHERKIKAAEREVGRLAAARSALEDTLEEAENAAEAREREREIARARQLKAEGEELIEEYGELAEEMVPVLERLQEIDDEFTRMDISRPPDRLHISPVTERFSGPNPSPLRETVIVPAGPDHQARFNRGAPWREPKPPREPPRKQTAEEKEFKVYDADGNRVDSPGTQGTPRRLDRGGPAPDVAFEKVN